MIGCSKKKDKDEPNGEESVQPEDEVITPPDKSELPDIDDKDEDTAEGKDEAETPKPDEKPTSTPTPKPTPTPEPTPAPLSLYDIMASIQYGVELPNVGNTDLTADTFKNYLFIDPIDGATALASDAMIGSIAHSVVLLKLPEGSDGDSVAASIKANANPRKWICVEAEKVSDVHKNGVVLLVMSDTATADAIVANFNYLMSK